MGALFTFGIFEAQSIVLDWHSVTTKFQVWRLFTTFLFAGKFSFNFVMHLYIFYENSLRYERNPYNTGAGGTSADYLFMLIVGMAMIWIYDFFQPTYVHSDTLLYMIMYVWSRREPENQLNIFGFKFQSVYLPWVYIAIRLLMGGDIMLPIVGIGAGHLYFFLIEVLPGAHSSAGNLIRTPQWCVRIIEILTARTQPRAQPQAAAAFGAAAPARNLPPQNRYDWGQGRTLGRG